MLSEQGCINYISPKLPYLQILHLGFNQPWIKKNPKPIPKTSKKQNLNFPSAGNYT